MLSGEDLDHYRARVKEIETLRREREEDRRAIRALSEAFLKAKGWIGYLNEQDSWYGEQQNPPLDVDMALINSMVEKHALAIQRAT